jgi:hypothetical protein
VNKTPYGSTGPWSPWRNEVQQPLHCLQYVEEVVRLSKLEEDVSDQVIEDRWYHRDGLKECYRETPTAQYVTYNIKKWGCLKARVVQRKPTLLNVSLPMHWPRGRFPEQPPSTNELHGRGFLFYNRLDDFGKRVFFGIYFYIYCDTSCFSFCTRTVTVEMWDLTKRSDLKSFLHKCWKGDEKHVDSTEFK